MYYSYLKFSNICKLKKVGLANQNIVWTGFQYMLLLAVL